MIPVNKRGKWNDLKVTQKIIDKYTGKERNKELQKTGPLDNAHVLGKVLNLKSVTDVTWEISKYEERRPTRCNN